MISNHTTFSHNASFHIVLFYRIMSSLTLIQQHLLHLIPSTSLATALIITVASTRTIQHLLILTTIVITNDLYTLRDANRSPASDDVGSISVSLLCAACQQGKDCSGHFNATAASQRERSEETLEGDEVQSVVQYSEVEHWTHQVELEQQCGVECEVVQCGVVLCLEGLQYFAVRWSSVIHCVAVQICLQIKHRACSEVKPYRFASHHITSRHVMTHTWLDRLLTATLTFLRLSSMTKKEWMRGVFARNTSRYKTSSSQYLHRKSL